VFLCKGMAEYNKYFDNISDDRGQFGLLFKENYIKAIKLDIDDDMGKKIDKSKNRSEANIVFQCKIAFFPKANWVTVQ
jgi:hypothetical protein